MSKLSKLKDNPWLLLSFVLKKIARIVPDKIQLSLLHRVYVGKFINWNNPETFTEKLQWLKIYNRNPEYTRMVDKYAVKDYVAEVIGKEYIIPTLGVWDKPEDIDWDSLPNQFVLKTTHGGGGNGVFICKDKNTFDKEKCINDLRKSLKSDLYWAFREWPYKDVPKRIIAEKYMMADNNESKKKDLPDYKFFCFNGEPHFCQVIRDRSTKETIDIYDTEWNHMPFVGLNPYVKNGLTSVERPGNLETMLQVCRKLAKDIPFSRIDLYVIDEKEYFGEITFYPASGYGKFTPSYWNERLGELINLDGDLIGGKVLIYSNIEFLPKMGGDLRDYKFFCSNGKVKFFKIDYNRQLEHRANYYTPNGKLMKFGEAVCPPDFSKELDIPTNLAQMIELANRLATNLPFARIDFYNINGNIYFGEITFYPASGFGKFTPENYNEIIGDMINLPI